ncbi:hypothetical protein JCM1841_001353 [Sporobolomyces salmonicolor]
MPARPCLPSLRPLARQLHTTRSLPSPAALPSLISSSLAASSSSAPEATTSLSGWVRSCRRQKNVSFAVLSDGSQVGGVQLVLPKGLDERLTVGCAATFKGNWVDSKGKGQSKEFRVEEVEFVGESDAETYPIPNTKQGIPLPILRKKAHLRPRKDAAAAMLRTRSEMSWAVGDYFRREGFVKVETPIITSSDCEGAGEVFRVADATPPPPSSAFNTFSTESAPPPPPPPARYLTVSSQLHLEAIASSLPRVYCLSPCFRAEKSDTARHLQEFWMLEAEVGFLDADVPRALEQVMGVAEASVRAVAAHVRSMPEFDFFARQSEGLDARVAGLLGPEPYARMTYTHAIDLLAAHSAAHPSAFVFPPTWGSGLQTEHEKWLAEEHVGGPVFVTDYPTPLKPFYMLPNAGERTTACFDLLVPLLGELAGGSLRQHDPSALLASLTAHGLDPEAYEWYLDLRRYGTTRHGGFGLGWERLVGLLTGEGNVRECIAFPRASEGSRF